MFKPFKNISNVYWVVITLCHNFRKSDVRTYVWEKGKRTCVLLTIGEQEREIQNAQVLSMSSNYGAPLRLMLKKLIKLCIKWNSTTTKVLIIC